MDGKQSTIRHHHLRRGIAAVVFVVMVLPSPAVMADPPPTFHVQGKSLPISSNGHSKVRIIRPEAKLRSVDPKSLRTTPVQLIQRTETANQTLDSEDKAADSENSVPSLNSRPTRTVDEILDTRGDITFRKTSLSEVVFMLSDLWHINIVASENVTGEVSGAFRDTPLREVLSAALTAGGYSYRQTGNSLIVLPADEVGTDDPTFISETIRIPLSLQSDTSAQEAAELLLSKRGRLKKIGESGMLVMDTASRVARIRKLFNELSSQDPASMGSAVPVAPNQITQSGIAYFSPQYTSAEEMSEPLQLALGDQVIVAAYPTENRILVKGNANDLRLASDAVRQLDRPRPQVRITAMIYDVGLSELERLGVNWSRDLRVNANAQNPALEDLTGTINQLFRFNADLATSGAASIGIGTVQESLAAGAFIEALDNSTEAKLLADPSITVTDRKQASIKIVREIPIVGSNPVEGSNAVFTQTEFKEAGVILQVQPRISDDQTIELSVQPEYSVVAEITSTGPVIDSRTADTTVRVSNGQIFVLGGLRQKSIVETVRGIPYLKDIKYVGKLFRSHDTDIRESELIVFLKPEIVYPCTATKPRERAASVVAEQQLNRIPHAEDAPWTPCCKDPNCPHHHPRPRINGGSDSLIYQSESLDAAMEMQEFRELEILAPITPSIQDESLRPMLQEPVKSFPQLHIENRLQNGS